ncbi:hypothetical protein D5F11_011465 [Siminovitchia terrae]|uniref:Uncharacterized protein n=1 Tax=Siminovitchia terrae TaxID=1914933 RepID=A0A429X943_SIMTE|nr:hypothetical protein [Siminovitchia terrae]RST59713.1 hypothetical protein D5F11_011465 [Siminovitchia terrae]
MAKYEVIHDFTDLQDDNQVYFKGDSFPDPVNKRIKKERINELLSNKNKQGRAVIKEIKE